MESVFVLSIVGIFFLGVYRLFKVFLTLIGTLLRAPGSALASFREAIMQRIRPRPLPVNLPGLRPPGWVGFKRNGMYFEFQIVRIQGAIRIYILAHPSYGNRICDGHSDHRYYDHKRKLYFVCVDQNHPLRDFADAKETARAWVRYTEHYIRTGEKLTA